MSCVRPRAWRALVGLTSGLVHNSTHALKSGTESWAALGKAEPVQDCLSCPRGWPGLLHLLAVFVCSTHSCHTLFPNPDSRLCSGPVRNQGRGMKSDDIEEKARKVRHEKQMPPGVSEWTRHQLGARAAPPGRPPRPTPATAPSSRGYRFLNLLV